MLQPNTQSMLLDNTIKCHVTNLTWKSELIIHTYDNIQKSDWILPENAKLIKKEKEIYSYQTIEQKDGTFLDIPIYKTKYYFEIQDIVSSQILSKEGENSNPSFVSYSLKENQIKEENIYYYIECYTNQNNKIKTYEIDETTWNTLKIGDVLPIQKIENNKITCNH